MQKDITKSVNNRYIISIDQSTQGTKAFLLDGTGRMLLRRDKSHRQIISDEGWVSHDAEEIYRNTMALLGELIRNSSVDPTQIAALAISNQRETSVAWDHATGESVGYAVVWQCRRAEGLCRELSACGNIVREKTGIPLSPYFPAAKFAWLLKNEPKVQELLAQGRLCLGTIDSYLVFRLTGGRFLTDYSNASRTQLFGLKTGNFDRELCDIFGIPMQCLPEIVDSDACFGETDLGGLLPQPIPIHAVMGDSHAALFGQGCLEKGMLKATYGTGSSIMMNVGETPVFSKNGLVSSVGFKVGGRLSYVLEGNLNYTGALITWLKKNLQLIECDSEVEGLAMEANPEDMTCIVPAFTGLGAPYWDSEARAAILGMTRITGKREIARAALVSIAQQITDIVKVMEKDTSLRVTQLRVDGGPTRNAYLMQMQSDLCGSRVLVPEAEELSGIGAAYAAGLAIGLYQKSIFEKLKRKSYKNTMPEEMVEKYRSEWNWAIQKTLENGERSETA